MTEQTSVWCLTGELTRKQSEALENSIEIIADMHGIFPPTCASFEQADTPLWKVDIYFAGKPDNTFINAVLSHSKLENWQYTEEQVEDRDWVSESQKLLAPVRAGRFFVYGSHDADKRDPDAVNLQIDAGQAFGTGKHETTSACLELIDKIANAKSPQTVLDIGTGTGVLALAAGMVWPNARITATDIDPIAIDVTRQNLSVNQACERKIGEPSGIALIVADGVEDALIQDDAPYDIVLANILAGPLIDMAKSITSVLSNDGSLILSGLLITQRDDVVSAYAQQGLEVKNAIESGDWTALHLKRKTDI